MSALTDRLFFALRPDAATVARIEALGERLRTEQGLRGHLLKPAHFHITLYRLGDFCRFPQELVERAMAAALTLRAAPFEIVLDQAMSFKRREQKNQPCVLLAGEPLAPLKALHAELVSVLKVAGLYRYASFKPHLTLLYDHLAIAPQPIEPLRWTAGELLLVNSLLGHSEHVVVASWPLQP
jgi:2'-5' RNA ligase